MCKTLEEQMQEALYKATVSSDPPMLEAATKVAQIYALEQQQILIQEMWKIKDYNKQTRFLADTANKIDSEIRKLKALKDGKE